MTAPIAAEIAGRTWHDLTLTLGPEYPCSWPGHQPFTHTVTNYFADVAGDQGSPLFSPNGAYHTRALLMDEHTGTHCDAPAHFFAPSASGLPGASEAGDVTVEQIEVQRCCGTARVVDCTALIGTEPGVSPTITVTMLQEHEARTRPFVAGDVVLFRADWDLRFYKPGRAGSGYAVDPFLLRTVPGWPAADADAMEYLASRGVACAGTDAPSMGSTHDGSCMHVAGLGAGLVYVEGLANLRVLPEDGAWFCFAPLKVARGSGAPGRAFAVS